MESRPWQKEHRPNQTGTAGAYRPLKRQLTLRLDADVVAWFKRRAKGGRGYQTDINWALRDYVRRRDKRAVG